MRNRCALITLAAALWLLPSLSHAETLIELARNGDVAALARAIDAGADVNAGSAQTTPLAEAVRRGHYEAASLLIASGADVNTPTKYYGDPVMMAAATSRPDLLRLLLRNGGIADTTHNGDTALHKSTLMGCVECVKALVEAGASVNFPTFGQCLNRTSLEIARTYHYNQIADYLIAHGAQEPLMWARP